MNLGHCKEIFLHLSNIVICNQNFHRNLIFFFFDISPNISCNLTMSFSRHCTSAPNFSVKTVSWFICFYSGSLLAITHLLLKHVSFPDICFHHLERDKLILSLEKFIFKFFIASSLAFQLVLRFFLDIRSRSYISEQIFDKCFFFFLIYLIFFEKNFFFRPWKVLYLNFFIHFIFLRQFFSIKGT